MAEEPPDRRGYQLCQAVRHGLEDSVHILLDHEDCHTFLNEAWEIQPTHHFTALMWGAVAVHQRTELLKLLIQRGAKLDLQDARTGQSALVLAARNGNTEIVRILVEAGANAALLTAGMADGVNALMAASYEGHDEAVRVLLDYGKQDVNARSSKGGCTALWLACVRGHLSVVRILLKHGGADAGLTDWAYGWAPAEAAKAEGHKQCYQLVEELSGRPYLLHRARCIGNDFEGHERVPDRALPPYIQGRVEQTVALPKVKVMFKRPRMRKVAKDVRTEHGLGKQANREKRKRTESAWAEAKEVVQVIELVGERLSEELCTELMMGLMCSEAGLRLTNRKK